MNVFSILDEAVLLSIYLEELSQDQFPGAVKNELLLLTAPHHINQGDKLCANYSDLLCD